MNRYVYLTDGVGDENKQKTKRLFPLVYLLDIQREYFKNTRVCFRLYAVKCIIAILICTDTIVYWFKGS